MLARLPVGPSHVIAQSMGGVLAARLAIEQPERVARLVLVATSGGLDVSALGGADWRADYLASLPGVPRWFVDDRTDLTERLDDIRAPTLLLWGDADPVSPVAVGQRLENLLPQARLRVIEGASHGFAEERPDEVAEAIRCHLVG
jgi:pimeloyl-ACP methyl ester carboxylesterase